MSMHAQTFCDVSRHFDLLCFAMTTDSSGNAGDRYSSSIYQGPEFLINAHSTWSGFQIMHSNSERGCSPPVPYSECHECGESRHLGEVDGHVKPLDLFREKRVVRICAPMVRYSK